MMYSERSQAGCPRAPGRAFCRGRWARMQNARLSPPTRFVRECSRAGRKLPPTPHPRGGPRRGPARRVGPRKRKAFKGLRVRRWRTPSCRETLTPKAAQRPNEAVPAASCEVVFPGRSGERELRTMAPTNARWAAVVGERATGRGFRSTFSDWSTEEGSAPMLAEAAVADVVQGVEGAYRRTDLLDERAGGPGRGAAPTRLPGVKRPRRGHPRGHVRSSGSQHPLPLHLPLPCSRHSASRNSLAPSRFDRILSNPTLRLGAESGAGSDPPPIDRSTVPNPHSG